MDVNDLPSQRPYTSKLALLSLLQTACCAPLFWPTFLCSPVGIIVIVDSLHVLDPLLTFLFYPVLKLSCCMASSDELISWYWLLNCVGAWCRGAALVIPGPSRGSVSDCCVTLLCKTYLHLAQLCFRVSIIILKQDLSLIHENLVQSAIFVWHYVH